MRNQEFSKPSNRPTRLESWQQAPSPSNDEFAWGRSVRQPNVAPSGSSGGATSAQEIVGGNSPDGGVLKLGAFGSDVLQLQRQLNQNLGANLDADGVFGQRTEEAVKRFQSARGLSADGVVGPQTRRALGAKASTRVQGTNISMEQLKRLGEGDKQRFFDVLRPIAEEMERKYGVPAAVTLAQAALESSYGKDALPGFNIFGIKGAGNAGTTRHVTEEVYNGRRVAITANFARFQSLRDAFEAHARLFQKSCYNRAMAQYERDGNPRRFAQNITGVYATAPDYGRVVSSIIGDWSLA